MRRGLFWHSSYFIALHLKIGKGDSSGSSVPSGATNHALGLIDHIKGKKKDEVERMQVISLK